MPKIFAIPDCHGRNDLLVPLLAQLKSSGMDLTTDTLIFLGDMVDRGSDSKGVIDTIRYLQKTYPANVVVLRGNHESLLLNALRSGRYGDLELWMINGGGATLKSFTGSTTQLIAEEYLVWLESLPAKYETDGFFFSHAPLPKEKDRAHKGAEFSLDELTWTYFPEERDRSRHHKSADGKDVVGVCGHIHALRQGIFAPRLYMHYYFLDAGCGCHPKAPLIACEVATKKIWWQFPDGKTVQSQKTAAYIPVPPLPVTP